MENELKVFEKANLTIFKQLSDFKKQIKLMQDEEKKVKQKLQQSMIEHGITSFKNDDITISYVNGSVSTSIDLKKLKEKEPELYEELLNDYPKVTTRASSVKINVK